MPRITPVSVENADAKTAATLAAIKAKVGMLPNLHATFAQAPSVLNAYLAFADALGTGSLTNQQREIVALATAQANGCQYCISAHTLLGKGAGLASDAILAARHGQGGDPVDAAIASLSVALVETRGQVSDGVLAAARAAGLTDGQIIEVIANVSLNTLTNFTNNVAATDIDFPVVELALAA